MPINYGTNDVSTSGLVTANSGNFTSSLQVNGTVVSISGHTHTTSNITDFDSSVSGLLPVTNIIGGTNISVVPSGTIYTIGVSGQLGSVTVQSLHISQRYTETVSALNISSGTLDVDLNTCNLFTCNLNANITTLTISNTPSTSGVAIGFKLIFTADGIARTITWPTSVKWAGGVVPTMTIANNERQIFSFVSTDNGTSWLGFMEGHNPNIVNSSNLYLWSTFR